MRHLLPPYIRFFSNFRPFSTVRKVKFSPTLREGSSIVIPISMGRFVKEGSIHEKSKIAYDKDITLLLEQTASLLSQKNISKVTVISTASLQGINWSTQLVDEVEKAFFSTHCQLLAKQSEFLTWDRWVESVGPDEFEQRYLKVVELSPENSEWYRLMVETHKNTRMSSHLAKSLKYQRMEYAAISLMKYDYLVYQGNISLAWAYMYHNSDFQYQAPTFVRASFEKQKNKEKISNSDATATNKLLLGNLEAILCDENYPAKYKKQLVDSGLSLFYAYGNESPIELR